MISKPKSVGLHKSRVDIASILSEMTALYCFCSYRWIGGVMLCVIYHDDIVRYGIGHDYWFLG